MINLFAIYLPLFYMAVFIGALAFSLSVDHWKSAIYLTLLYLLAWVDSIWFDPTSHMLANLTIFSLILFASQKSDGLILAVVTLLMMITNGVFAIQGGSEFYRLSIINLLFLIQCLIVIKVSYNAHKSNSNSKGNDGYFMAKVHSSKY